jgi:hypothetical protein
MNLIPDALAPTIAFATGVEFQWAPSNNIFIFLVRGMVLECELRALHFLDRHRATRATPTALFGLVILR